MKKSSNSSILDYRKLFEELTPREFLGNIFFAHNFTRLLCLKYKTDFQTRFKQINRVFSYFHEDDLYKYFVINHSFHKNKSKQDYLNSLFVVISDLIHQVPTIEFEPLETELTAPPIYVEHNNELPKLVNLARNFFYYYDYMGFRESERMSWEERDAFLYEIYQKELLPLDISQQSYL